MYGGSCKKKVSQTSLSTSDASAHPVTAEETPRYPQPQLDVCLA